MVVVDDDGATATATAVAMVPDCRCFIVDGRIMYCEK